MRRTIQVHGRAGVQQRTPRKRVGDGGADPDPLGRLGDGAQGDVPVPIEKFDREDRIEARRLGADRQVDVGARGAPHQDHSDSHEGLLSA